MRLVLFLLRTSKGMILYAVTAGTVSGAAAVALIALIQRELSTGLSGGQKAIWEFSVLSVVAFASNILAGVVLVRVAQQAIFDLRLQLSRRIVGASLRNIEEIGVSKLLALLNDDVTVLANSLTALPPMFINSMIVIFCLMYFWWLSRSTFFAVLSFVAVGVASCQVLILKALGHLRLAREEQDALFKHFRGLTEGAKELKLHAPRRNAFVDEILGSCAASYRKSNVVGLTFYSVAGSWGQLLFFLLIAFLLYILPALEHLSNATVGAYVLTTVYMIGPLEGVLGILPLLGRASVALKKVEGMGVSLTSEDANVSRACPERLKSEWSCVEAIDVTYSYWREGDDSPFVLGPISTTFPRGELTFLVGGNGSGKTTFAKLLVSLYRPDAGSFRLNGESIGDTNREWYRSHFSVVFADFFLFDRFLGIRDDNLQIRAEQCLARFQLDHKVQIQSGGFSTTCVSQGQRKRLALLTSYLEDRDFYIFDEWAADQDPVFKEVFYNELLPELKNKGKSILVITHDDKYYHLADRILKMDSGKLESDVYRPDASDRKVHANFVG